jgi:ribonuclease HII
MFEYSKVYPQYGFDRHVGYATKKHREAVKTHGVLDIHRKSYKFIRELPEISDQSTLF